MIVNGKGLIYSPYADSRGHVGESGQLYIARDGRGCSCLVKTRSADVTNEFVAHKVAKLIGVPTSNAFLIDDRGKIEVGINYEKDFKRVFVQELKALSDEDRRLADFMAYMALMDLLLIDDNLQLAFSHGKLCSFDYAISFCMDDLTYGAMCTVNDHQLPFDHFQSNFQFGKRCDEAINLLERKSKAGKRMLRETYIDTYVRFLYIDPEKLRLVWNDLNAVFPPVVADFYRTCIEDRMKALNSMIDL